MSKAASRKVVSLVTAALTAFSGVSPVFGAADAVNPAGKAPSANTAAPQVPATVFQDTYGHWGGQAISEWSGYGVVNGYNGQFRPNAPVTRAEFATMIDNVMQYIERGPNSFSDVKEGQWYADAVLKLSAAGVMKGSGGKALPGSSITRQEAAVMMSGAFSAGKQGAAVSFKDSGDIAGWARGAVQDLAGRHVIGGLPDGSFKPGAYLTRAEAVTLFDNLVANLIHKPGEYTGDVTGNVVVNTAGASLKNMKIDGDVYIAQGVGEGEVTFDNVVIKGTVHVQGGGEHSIIFNNVDVQGSLVVNKYNGKVRILATGSTSVSVTVLESGALLVTKELTGGGFETVEISAEVTQGQEIKLDGSFNKIINRSSQASITATGTIKEFVAETAAALKGDVKVEKVSGAAGSAVTVNGAAVQPSASPAPSAGAAAGGAASGGSGAGGGTGGTGGGSGGSGDGGGNGGTDGGSQTVAVTGVTASEVEFVLQVGESKQLTAAVLPAGASNPAVTWTAAPGSEAIEVTSGGLVTAKAPGTGTAVVTTQDGGFTASVKVNVEPAAFGVSLAPYAGSLIAPDAQIEEAVRTNSASVHIAPVEGSLTSKNAYATVLSASSPLQPTSVGHAVYAVLTLTDRDGTEIADLSSVRLTVNGATYSPDFGAGLTAQARKGSLVLPLNVEQPDKPARYNVILAGANHADTTLTIAYRPFGMPLLRAVGPVTGEAVVGAELSAGAAEYEGTPAGDQAAYQWYRSDSEKGLYTPIAGATSAKYTASEADAGMFLRVQATAGDVHATGSALSPAFGPVQKPFSAEEVIAAIKAEYLGKNADAGQITGNLALPQTLANYPGVTLAWSTSNPEAVSAAGIVTRHQENDQLVSLTVTLGGRAAGSHTFNLIVRALGRDQVGMEGYVDGYFVSGYPQAYVKDGTIHVRYALNKPADLYMVVNVINGTHKSSVKSVLEGHSGIDNDVIYVNEWPYYEIRENQVNQVQDVDTGVNITSNNNREARVEFVIADGANGYTSPEVTTIKFDQKTVGALDTQPPYTYTRYINKALDTIYVYYDEHLDPASVPAPEDFSLSTGTVNAVSIFNYEDEWGMTPAYVKLSVSGVTDAKNLSLSYKGSAIQDLTDARNKAEVYQGREVLAMAPQIKKAVIGSDRRSVLVEIEPGWYNNDNKQSEDLKLFKTRFTVEVAGAGYKPDAVTYSSSTMERTYMLTYNTPLPAGEASIQLDTTGIADWAKDAYPAQIVAADVVELAAPGTPTAVYSSQSGRLTLTFAPGFELDNHSAAAGLVLKVDGTEYVLRGYIVSSRSERVDGQYVRRQIDINLADEYSWKFKAAVEAGTDVQIKYAKANGDNRQQLTDAAGALLPDFDYVAVTKQP